MDIYRINTKNQRNLFLIIFKSAKFELHFIQGIVFFLIPRIYSACYRHKLISPKVFLTYCFD